MKTNIHFFYRGLLVGWGRIESKGSDEKTRKAVAKSVGVMCYDFVEITDNEKANPHNAILDLYQKWNIWERFWGWYNYRWVLKLYREACGYKYRKTT